MPPRRSKWNKQEFAHGTTIFFPGNAWQTEEDEERKTQADQVCFCKIRMTWLLGEYGVYRTLQFSLSPLVHLWGNAILSHSTWNLATLFLGLWSQEKYHQKELLTNLDFDLRADLISGSQVAQGDLGKEGFIRRVCNQVVPPHPKVAFALFFLKAS